jgi:hypothetical protein
MRVNVVLEWDEEELGQGWMNIDNLEILLYSRNFTRKELLEVVSYDEGTEAKSGQ